MAIILKSPRSMAIVSMKRCRLEQFSHKMFILLQTEIRTESHFRTDESTSLTRSTPLHHDRGPWSTSLTGYLFCKSPIDCHLNRTNNKMPGEHAA